MSSKENNFLNADNERLNYEIQSQQSISQKNSGLSTNDYLVMSEEVKPIVFRAGLSGSLTHLTDGTTYINASSSIGIFTSSNGSITISYSGTIDSGYYEIPAWETTNSPVITEERYPLYRTGSLKYYNSDSYELRQYGSVIKYNTNVLYGAVSVLTSVPDGNGGIFIGGSFDSVQGHSRRNIAHIDASGSVSDWDISVNDSVKAMKLSGSTLFVGGDFTKVGHKVDNTISLNSLNGEIENPFNLDVNGEIYSWAETPDGELIIGGDFKRCLNQTRNGLAKLDSNGYLTPWNPNPNSGAIIKTILVKDQNVFVGGIFSSISGSSTKNLAKINLGTGHVSGSWAVPWNSNFSTFSMSTDVRSLSSIGDELLVGGLISGSATNQIPIGLISLNINNGQISTKLSSSLGLARTGNGISVMAISGSVLFAGGNFATGSMPTDLFDTNLIAQSKWGNKKSFNVKNGEVQSSVILGDESIILGGTFTQIQNQNKTGLARINPQGHIDNTFASEIGIINYDFPMTTVRISTNINTGGGGVSIGIKRASDGATLKTISLDNSLTTQDWIFDDLPTNTQYILCVLDNGFKPSNIRIELFIDGISKYINNFGQTLKSYILSGSPPGTLYAWTSANGVLTSNIFRDTNTNFTLEMYDSFGDTWNGATVQIVRVDVPGIFGTYTGPTSGITVTQQSVSGLTPGGTYQLVWVNTGGYPYEVRVRMISGGAVRYDSGYTMETINSTINKVLFTWMAGASNYTTTELSANNPTIKNDTSLKVNNLLISGSTLYVGGKFSAVKYQNTVYPRTNLASFDLANNGMPTNWSPGINGEVKSLLISKIGNEIYVGGSFSHATGSSGGQIFSRGGICRINTINGNIHSADPMTITTDANSINDIVYDGSDILVGGNQNKTWNQSGDAIIFNGNQSPQVIETDGEIFDSILMSDGSTIVGGNFAYVNGIARNNLARINSNGSVASWDPNLNGAVKKLYLDSSESRLYVGGAFTQAGINTKYALAIYDMMLGGALLANPAPSFRGNAISGNPEVLDIHCDATRIFVGGLFDNVNGVNIKSFAVLNKSTGLIDANWNLTHLEGYGSSTPAGVEDLGAGTKALHPRVFTSEYVGNNVYVGGRFTEMVYAATGSAEFNSDSTSFDLGLRKQFGVTGGSVYASVILNDGSVIIAGDFTRVLGDTRNRIAKINSNGTLSDWNPNISNGIVHTLIAKDNFVFAGGTFNGANSIGGNTQRDRLAAFDATNNATPLMTSWNPGANGTVRTLHIGEDEKLYVGGDFTVLGGINQFRIGVLSSNASTTHSIPNDGTWNIIVPSTVNSIVSSGSFLYAGGNFTAISTVASGSAVFDTSDLSDLTTIGGSGLPRRQFRTNGDVLTSAILSNGDIVIGGTFTTVLGQNRARLAKIKSDNTLDQWNPGNTNGTVEALLVSGSGDDEVLYVGGQFTTLAGSTTPRNRLGSINIGAGETLASSWDPNANGTVNALLLSGTTLFVGGAFTSIYNKEHHRFVAFDTKTGLISAPWNHPSRLGGVNNTVRTLAISGSNLYLGGDFTSVSQIASGSVVFSTADINANLVNSLMQFSASGGVINSSIILPDGSIIVGGTFTSILNNSRQRLARINPDNTIHPWNPGANNAIETLLLSGSGWDEDSILYVGGQFNGANSLGGQSRNRLGRIPLNSNFADSLWDPDANNTVNSLILSGNALFVGGQFTSIGGQRRHRLSAFDTLSSTAITLPIFQQKNRQGGIENGSVLTLEASGSNIYLGGSFTSTFDIASGSAVFNTVDIANNVHDMKMQFDVNLNGAVGVVNSSVMLPDGGLIIGGWFTSVLGETRSGLARINPDNTIHPWNPGANGIVESIVLSGSGLDEDSILYVGGRFNGISSLGGQPRNRLGKIPLNSNTADSWNPNANNTVNSLLLSGNTLFVGGQFTEIEGKSRHRFTAFDTINGTMAAPWNKEIFSGSGVNGIVYAMTHVTQSIPQFGTSGKNLYLGGTFTSIYSVASGSAIFDIDNIMYKNGQALDLLGQFSANGDVNASVFLEDGSMIIGGSFTSVMGQTRNRLAKINADKTLNSSWRPFSNGTIKAMVTSGSLLYLGGDFSVLSGTTPGDFSRNEAGAITISDGEIDTWDPQIGNGSVNVLLVSGSQIYIGGSFTSVKNQSNINFVGVDSVTGDIANPWNLSSHQIGTNGPINALSSFGPNIYVGGSFSMTYNVASGSAQFSTSDIDAGSLGYDGHYRANGTIFASIVLQDGSKILGGSFTTMSGSTRMRLAKINPDNTLNQQWIPIANGPVYSLALSGTSDLYVGGGFTEMTGSDGQKYVRNRLAILNLDNGNVDSWNPSVNNGQVNVIEFSGSKIWAGGSFTSIGSPSITRSGLVTFDSSTKELIADEWDIFPSSVSVNSVVPVDSGIYVGGQFNAANHGTIGSGSRGRSDIITTSAVSSRPFPKLNVAGGEIYAVVPDPVGGGFYVGGDFTSIQGVTRLRLAKIKNDGTIDTNWYPTGGGITNGSVACLHINDDYLYVGGTFSGTTSFFGQNRNRIARIQISTQNIDPLWNAAGANDIVNAIASNGNNLYIGGAFTTFNGAAVNKLIRHTISTGTQTNLGTIPRTNTTSHIVYALACDGSHVYVGGDFVMTTGTTIRRFGRISHAASVFDAAWQGFWGGTTYDDSQRVTDIALSSTQVYLASTISSTFTVEVSTGTRSYIARANKSTATIDTGWVPSVSGQVRSISVDEPNSTIYISGYFGTVQGGSVFGLAKLSMTSGAALLPWDARPASLGFYVGAYNLLQLIPYSTAINIGQIIAKNGDLIFLSLTDYGRLNNLVADATQAYPMSNLVKFSSDGTLNLNWKSNPAINAAVLTMVSSGSSIYVGGGFTAPASYIMKLDSTTGARDSTWLSAGSTGGGVRSLALSGTTLYVGGDFSAIGGLNRNELASVSTLGAGVVTPWNPSLNNSVYTLSTSGSVLIAGGTFTEINSVSRNNIFALTSSTGEIALNWNANAAGGAVNALTSSGPNLIIGGNFTSIGGNSNSVRLGAVDAVTGARVSWDRNVNGNISSFYNLWQTLIIGGTFTTVNGVSHKNVAIVDSSFNPFFSVTYDNWTPNPDSSVNHVNYGDSLFLGGSFKEMNLTRNGLVAIDMENGERISEWKANAETPVDVRALHISGSNLIIGGGFTSLGGVSTTRLGAVSHRTGNRVAWSPNVSTASSIVSSIAVSGTTIFAGGTFTSPRNYLFAVNSTDAGATLSNWNPAPNANVNNLNLSGSTLFAGGAFEKMSKTRNYIAALSSSTGIFPESWNPGAGGNVNSLFISGTNLYVGGAFTSLSGNASSVRLGALNVSSSARIPWNVNISSGEVKSIVVSGTTAFAGGFFNTINTTNTRNNLFAINTNDGSLRSWNPNFNASVNKVEFSGSILFVGGGFTNLDTKTRNYLTAYNKETGLNSNTWTPVAKNTVLTLILSGSNIVAGGTFTELTGSSNLISTRYVRNRLGLINAETGEINASWNPNLNSTVRSLAMGQINNIDHIVAGGDFTTIGGSTNNPELVAINASSGNRLNWVSNPNGVVNHVNISGSVVVVGGSFRQFDGDATSTTRNRLMAINVSSSFGQGQLTNWAPLSNNAVNVLEISGSQLFVGGTFTSLTSSAAAPVGFTRNYLGEISLNTGIIDSSWDANISVGTGFGVNDIAVSGSVLYVAGNINGTVRGVSRRHAFSLSTQDASLSSWNPRPNAQLLSLNVSGSKLILGGAMTSLSQSRNNLTKMESIYGNVTWGTTWDAGTNFLVKSIIYDVDNSKFYVGGYFDTINGISSPRLGVIDSTGTPSIFNASNNFIGPSYASRVNSLVFSGTGSDKTLLIGGKFDYAGSHNLVETYTAEQLGILKTGEFFDGTGSLTLVNSITPNANRVSIVGQNFLTNPVTGSLTKFLEIAKANVIQGSKYKNINIVNDANRRYFTVSGSQEITSLLVDEATNRIYMASIDNAAPKATRIEWAPNTMDNQLSMVSNVNNGARINSMALSGSRLFVGGTFTNLANVPRKNLGAINIGGLNQIDKWYPDSPGTVNHLTLSGSYLHISSLGTTSSLSPIKNLMAIDLNDGQVYSWYPMPDSRIEDMIISGSTLYVGGSFLAFSNTPRYRIGALDITNITLNTGSVLEMWNPTANGPVNSMALSGTNLYVGGEFSALGGALRDYFGVLNTTTGTVVDSGEISPSSRVLIRGLKQVKNKLYMTMDSGFSTRGFIWHKLRSRLAAFDTTYRKAIDEEV